MSNEEIVKAMKTAMANNTFSLEELAKELNLDGVVKNADDKNREKMVEGIKELLELPADAAIADVKKAIEDLFKEYAEAAESVAETTVNKLSGGTKRKLANGVEVNNSAYEYGKSYLKGYRGKRLNRRIEELKTDSVFTDLVSKNIDPYSQTNMMLTNAASIMSGILEV